MKPPHDIQSDTPIRPQIIAVCVWEEAGAWLGEANTVYANNERFRRRIQGKHGHGRDYLWMFMRHWLAAKLWEHRPHLYARMPAAYSLGQELTVQPRSRNAVRRVRLRGSAKEGIVHTECRGGV